MKVLVFATICVGICFGYIFHEGPDPDAGPTKCISKRYPVLDLNRGEVLNVPFECVRISCHDDGSVTGMGCTPLIIRKGCFETRQSSQLPYPDCCPIEVCPSKKKC